MRVSIITVVYNNVEYIGDAIQSVLSQDYDNVEHIVIDGENKSFHDYKNKYKIFSLGGKILNLLGLERRQYR